MLLREITSLFYGNEMFYGLGLGTWLLFTGLGSLMAPRFKLFKKRPALLGVILGGWFVLLPLVVIFLRWWVAKTVPLGELPGFGFSFLILMISLFIFCFPLGALFVLRVEKKTVNRAYFFETIGFCFGGLLFSFILATASFSLGLKWRYPDLIKAINSKYQQIIITQKESQRNYFLAGQLAFTNQENLENKQLVSLIRPFVREPGKVLVFGNPNLASEIKHQFSSAKVVFLEIDEKLQGLEKEFLDLGVKPVLNDPRKFLREASGYWDLIIFTPGNPQTLLTNRYFTKECFEQAKNRLTQQGIFVLLIYLPTDYQSEEATRFGGSIYQTLKTVFPKLELLTPEDQLLFLAGQSEIQIDKLKINPIYGDYFWHQVQNPKREKILERLAEMKTKINRDFEPATFFYQQLFWQTIFNFKAPVLLIKVVNFVPWVLLVLLLLGFWWGKNNFRLGLMAGSSSFILMSLVVLMILIFQTQIGYLYSQISLIFAAVLLGMGIGVILARGTNFKFVFLGYLPFLILVQQANFWPLTALGIGLVGGTLFALINKTYLKKFKNLGFIYAFDLFGGFFGAILTSSFLLPVFGLGGLTRVLAAMVLVSWLATAKLQE